MGSGSRVTKGEAKEMRRLSGEGLKGAEIAEQMGRSVSAVYRALNTAPAGKKPKERSLFEIEGSHIVVRIPIESLVTKLFKGIKNEA